jgi:hypothetical protein
LAVAVVGRDFVVATTFLGDDHLFRTFARLEPNPWRAFVHDKHGGEYYRPLPMLLWWVLERIGRGSAYPFALMAFALHCACAALLVIIAERLAALTGKPTARSISVLLPGVLFLLAPAAREAALWFAASTDLLATAAMLAALACWLSPWPRPLALASSLLFAILGLLSKETALALPLMIGSSGCLIRCRDGRAGSAHARALLVDTLPFLIVAALYLIVRSVVLGGMGGSNDARAPLWAVALQILSGLLHALSAYDPLPDWAAWAMGGLLLVFIVVVLRRSRLAEGPLEPPRASSVGPSPPELTRVLAIWTLAALAPLSAAGWVVGARYFYGATAPLMLLLALALRQANAVWLTVAILAAQLGFGALAANRRAADITVYRQAVRAAVAAVNQGVARGGRVFLVRSGVKDLDLAIKLDRAASPAVLDTVVIPDVPASFVRLPPAEEGRLGFLLALPPLPPSGAYRFGSARIVGLARREEAPALDDVLARLPDLRVIRLRLDARPVGWEDVAMASTSE